MARFADREAAGSRLADRLLRLQQRGQLGPVEVDRVRVLALPRGGVPVARPIARAWHTEARLLLVRKLGLPGHAELAMGAIAAIGDQVRVVRNEQVLDRAAVSAESWDRVLEAETAELRRRMAQFAGWTATDPQAAAVILVDDGLATGSTMQAAVAAVRSAGAGPIIAAVPVASPQAAETITDTDTDTDPEREVRVVSLTLPDPMIAVGEAYEDFHQLDDEEVLRLLSEPPPHR